MMSRSQATTNTARGMMTAALTLIAMFIAPACTRDPAASADTAARSSGAADARARCRARLDEERRRELDLVVSDANQ